MHDVGVTMYLKKLWTFLLVIVFKTIKRFERYRNSSRQQVKSYNRAHQQICHTASLLLCLPLEIVETIITRI